MRVVTKINVIEEMSAEETQLLVDDRAKYGDVAFHEKLEIAKAETADMIRSAVKEALDLDNGSTSYMLDVAVEVIL
jgi:hypothetical protein